MVHHRVLATFLLLSLCAIGDAQQLRKDLADKVVELVLNQSTFKSKDIFAIIDALASEAMKGVKYADLDVQKTLVDHGPKDKIIILSNAKSSLDNCLKGKNRNEKTGDVINLAKPTLNSAARPLYTELLNKSAENKKNNKSEAEIRSNIYKNSRTRITKKVVQTVITNLAKNLPCPVWQCTLTATKTLISYGQYKHDKENCVSPTL